MNGTKPPEDIDASPDTADAETQEGEPQDEEPQDQASLPDAPLFALLRTIEGEVGPEAIDRVWLFPPRRLKAGETAVVVVSAYHEADDDRRRVVAAHYTAPAQAAEPRLEMAEFGVAPADRVGRVVEDVVERLKEEGPPQPPRSFAIERQPDRWSAMLLELAGKYLEEASQRLGPT